MDTTVPQARPSGSAILNTSINRKRLVPEHSRLEDDEASELVSAAKRGDEEAFKRIYLTYFDGLYAYLRMALNDGELAEEATQQVFIKVLDAIDLYRSELLSFHDWLFGIARSHVIQRLSRASRASVGEPNGATRTHGSLGSEQELRALGWTSDDDLILLLDRLPESERQALVLGHVLGFKGSEVAEALGTDEGTVRQLQRRAFEFLRERLSALGREPSAGGRLSMRRYGGRRGALRPPHSVSLLR